MLQFVNLCMVGVRLTEYFCQIMRIRENQIRASQADEGPVGVVANHLQTEEQAKEQDQLARLDPK